MRINKFISSCGIASRRKADILIKSGQVTVNEKVIITLGIDIDPKKDKVKVAGQLCKVSNSNIYVVLNKPQGFVCTHASFKNEKSIFSLLPKKFNNLKIAGRLDKTSEGLVILSDDGDFINQLTHPKFNHQKEYEVMVNEKLSNEEIQTLIRGVRLEEGVAKADRLVLLKGTSYSMIIHQGWNRQIRRMMMKVGKRIKMLKRVREGKISLGELSSGKFNIVNRDQVI